MKMKRTNKLRWFTNWILPALIGISIAFCIKFWIATIDEVPSLSMYPTIPAVSEVDFAVISVNKVATEFGQIYRGEVVVFHFPDDPSELFVKRVIGMPGDTVTVTANSVYLNGKLLNESNPNISESNGTKLGTYHVPLGHYFMLGDNRSVSDDSRFWKNKYVTRSAIIGEANLVIYPFNKMEKISQSLSDPE